MTSTRLQRVEPAQNKGQNTIIIDWRRNSRM